LMDNRYEIVEEDIVAEAGHIYELIKAKLTDQVHPLTVKEVEFGPLLLKQKTPVFYQKWEGQEKYYQKLLANLNKAKQKDEVRIKQVEDLLAMIQEELAH
ncbi:tRNA (adenine(22)-N(1))-methyltransferase TrmK, partial [Lactobacillus equicursoris]